MWVSSASRLSEIICYWLRDQQQLEKEQWLQITLIKFIFRVETEKNYYFNESKMAILKFKEMV